MISQHWLRRAGVTLWAVVCVFLLAAVASPTWLLSYDDGDGNYFYFGIFRACYTNSGVQYCEAIDSSCVFTYTPSGSSTASYTQLFSGQRNRGGFNCGDGNCSEYQAASAFAIAALIASAAAFILAIVAFRCRARSEVRFARIHVATLIMESLAVICMILSFALWAVIHQLAVLDDSTLTLGPSFALIVTSCFVSLWAFAFLTLAARTQPRAAALKPPVQQPLPAAYAPYTAPAVGYPMGLFHGAMSATSSAGSVQQTQPAALPFSVPGYPMTYSFPMAMRVTGVTAANSDGFAVTVVAPATSERQGRY